MKYPLNPALPPLDFRDLPPEAVESYRSWFRREAHNRVQLLKSYVSSFDPNWTADFSESSFASIDQLFSSSIAVRELSNKELAAYGLAISPTSRPRILVPASMSFAYDIGIYLGESLTRSAAGAKYEQYSKRDAIDFGQFVVTAGWIDLDPYSLIKIYGIRRSRGDKIDSLTTFFEAWCQRLMLPDPRKLARVANRSGGGRVSPSGKEGASTTRWQSRGFATLMKASSKFGASARRGPRTAASGTGAYRYTSLSSRGNQRCMTC